MKKNSDSIDNYDIHMIARALWLSACDKRAFDVFRSGGNPLSLKSIRVIIRNNLKDAGATDQQAKYWTVQTMKMSSKIKR